MSKTPTMATIQAVLIYERDQSIAADAHLLSLAIQRLKKAFRSAPICSNRFPSQSEAKAVYEAEKIENLASGSALQDALKKLQTRCQGVDDSIALCYGWYPLLDLELLQEVLADHSSYLAHFSYGENIPLGLVPDFISQELLAELSHLPDIPEDLRAFVLKHIEKYDVETFYKNPDLRQYRLDFSTQSARSQKLAKDTLYHKPELKYAELPDLILSHPEILRPYPAFFEIELCTSSPLWPFYSPVRRKLDSCLDPALAQKLLSDIEANGMYQDISLALGGLGEPLEHPLFLDIIESFLKSEKIKRIYLESFGLKLDKKMSTALNALAKSDKVHIILRLDSLQKANYAQIYGADLFAKVYENILSLEQMDSKERRFSLYAEMRRIKENDHELTAYFDRFEKSPFTVILQKYNRYIDMLPERRMADLNPLHQDFCWHLTRDFYLNAEGKVPICKQDPFASRAVSLSFAKHSITEILAKTQKYHSSSVQSNYAKIPMPCQKCDEWYTFNA